MSNLPPTLSFGRFVVTIDDGSGTNQVAPCGFLKKSLKFNANSSDTVVPDCDDPDLAGWVERNVVSLSAEISGSGVLDMANTALWMGFLLGAVSRKCVVNFNLTGANGGFKLSGNFILTDWALDNEKNSGGGRTQQSVTLQSDGLLTYTVNA